MRRLPMMPRLSRARFGMMLAALGGMDAAWAQSLTEALAEAYRTNPQLLAQRALLRATDEMVPQALANWRRRSPLPARPGMR
jgi:outer membrane protein